MTLTLSQLLRWQLAVSLPASLPPFLPPSSLTVPFFSLSHSAVGSLVTPAFRSQPCCSGRVTVDAVIKLSEPYFFHVSKMREWSFPDRTVVKTKWDNVGRVHTAAQRMLAPLPPFSSLLISLFVTVPPHFWAFCFIPLSRSSVLYLEWHQEAWLGFHDGAHG